MADTERQLLQAQKKIAQLKAKAAQKSMKELRKSLLDVTKKIVRLQSNKCFTCDVPLLFKERIASHFWSAGIYPATRWEFSNIRVSCIKCNWRLHGNLAEYAYRLQKELGEAKYEELYRLKGVKKSWSRSELEGLLALRLEIYRKGTEIH